jgi:recombination protein RecT
MRSGQVSNIHADVVCEKDEFDFDRGQLLHHRINFREERGPVFAVYAICRFKDGQEKCDVMTKHDIELIRSRSRAKDNGPWVTDWNEMAKKTVFRRLSKWLPLSAEFRDALDADAEAVEERRFEVARPVFEAGSFLPQASIPAAIESAPTPEPPTPAPELTRSDPPDFSPVKPPVAHRKALADFLERHAISFTDLQTWVISTEFDQGWDAIASVDEVPEGSAARLLRSQAGLLRVLKPQTPAAANVP